MYTKAHTIKAALAVWVAALAVWVAALAVWAAALAVQVDTRKHLPNFFSIFNKCVSLNLQLRI
jgi:type IV secretory pathway TrbD component